MKSSKTTGKTVEGNKNPHSYDYFYEDDPEIEKYSGKVNVLSLVVIILFLGIWVGGIVWGAWSALTACGGRVE